MLRLFVLLLIILWCFRPGCSNYYTGIKNSLINKLEVINQLLMSTSPL